MILRKHFQIIESRGAGWGITKKDVLSTLEIEWQGRGTK
jgi:hypothetical protein